MKTYSLALQDENGIWYTNVMEYFSIDWIDWKKVEEFCLEKGYLAYGYYYGVGSSKLTSSKCRTVLKELK